MLESTSGALSYQLSYIGLVDAGPDGVLSVGVVVPGGGALRFHWLSWLSSAVVCSLLQSDGLNGT